MRVDFRLKVKTSVLTVQISEIQSQARKKCMEPHFWGGGFYSMEEVYVAVMFVECMDEIKLSALNHLTAFPSMPALFHSLLRKTA